MKYVSLWAGRGFLSHQLKALGLLRDLPLPLDSLLARVLSDMYDALGDQLSLQYGGNPGRCQFSCFTPH